MIELPFYMNDLFGHYTGLVIGALLGFAFGFVLERSGFGRATVLAAQFYFTDMRVLKVMFTSIITALLGTTILSGIGVLDISKIAVPHTYLWPQLFGGLLLGVGFITSGYCPGTGVVAMASGKLDGLVAIIGVMLGSVLFGIGYPLYEGFYHSGDLGVLRLPDLLGVPQALVAVGVTLMAIGMFIGGEKLEHIFTKGHGPDRAPVIRRRVFAGLSAIAVLGLATLLVSQSEPAQSERRIGTISPLEFAQMAIEDPAGYYLVEMRVLDTDADRIPGALAVTAEDPDAAFVADLPTTRTVILYGNGGIFEMPEAVTSFEGEVLIIEGGYDTFAAEILEAPLLGDEPTPAHIEEFKMRSALHAYFTGASIQEAPAPVRPKKQIRRANKKEGGC
jgi:hypothetical protein